jgi:hypothetical protein
MLKISLSYKASIVSVGTFDPTTGSSSDGNKLSLVPSLG